MKLLISHERYTISEERRFRIFKVSQWQILPSYKPDSYPNLCSPEATDRVKSKATKAAHKQWLNAPEFEITEEDQSVLQKITDHPVAHGSAESGRFIVILSPGSFETQVPGQRRIII